MRLIDADKILEYAEKYYICNECEDECVKNGVNKCEIYQLKESITAVVSTMPTAYDVDDVAIELKKHYKQARHEAIKIVRDGLDV